MKLVVTGPAYWKTREIVVERAWLYLASCEKYGVTGDMRRFYGIGATQYPGGAAMRVYGQLEFLKTIQNEFTHVLFSDLWDVLFVRPIGDIIAGYEHMGSPALLMGGCGVERGFLDLHPPETDRYLKLPLFDHAERYRYPSTSFHIGEIGYLIDRFGRIETGHHNESRPIANAIADGILEPVIDSRCEIFQAIL